MEASVEAWKVGERTYAWERLARLDPLLVDGLPALLILAIKVGIYGSQPPPDGRDGDVLTSLALLTSTLPLVWRRRAPLIVLTFLSAWMILYEALYSPAAAISLSIAAYTAAAHRERSKEFLAALSLATFASLILELRAAEGLRGIDKSPAPLAPDLVAELDHAVLEGARSDQLHCAVREPTLEERLADAQRDWDHGHVHLV